MKLCLAIVFLIVISTELLAGPIYDEAEAINIKDDYFGIVGTQTTISPKSFCTEAAYEETTRSTGEESKTEEYISAKILYHVYYTDCVEKSVRVGVRFVSVDQEKKFCDKASLDADVKDTISKVKSLKQPTTGKFSTAEFKRFIFTMEQTQKDQPISCARYFKRNVDPKVIVKSVGSPLKSEILNSDDSSRTKLKEKSNDTNYYKAQSSTISK
jgi:hypothetical protein